VIEQIPPRQQKGVGATFDFEADTFKSGTATFENDGATFRNGGDGFLNRHRQIIGP
jgi:hypothetical protein